MTPTATCHGPSNYAKESPTKCSALARWSATETFSSVSNFSMIFLFCQPEVTLRHRREIKCWPETFQPCLTVFCFICLAAHCLWPKLYFDALKDNANVYVTIKNANAELMDVKVHPDWKFNKGNYDADIAVVTLFGPVTITETVQPICLPGQNDGFLIAQNGVVVSLKKCFSVFANI